MSCSSCNDESDGCNPCNQVQNNESLASALNNLTVALLGKFVKTTTNGHSVWTAVCDPNEAGLDCYPRTADEGFVCYILRVLEEIGIFAGGAYDSGTAYCAHTMVSYSDSLYISNQAVAAGILPTNATYWDLLITAPTGPAGPQGTPGASGAGSAVNFAIQTATSDVTLTDTSAEVFCEPAAPMAVNLPAVSLSLTGKWFKIWTDGSFNVTITANGLDRIDYNGTLVSTLVLSVAGSSVELVNNGVSKWRVQ